MSLRKQDQSNIDTPFLLTDTRTETHQTEAVELEGPFELSELAPPLVRSAPGYVRWVQSALNRTLGTKLVVDGSSGPATRAAVAKFQRRHQLNPNGIVGPATEAKLAAESGLPAPAIAGGTASAAASRARYASWSDADDRRKGRNPRDQGAVAAGLQGATNVLEFPMPGGISRRIFLLQNFKIDGAALRPDHKQFLEGLAKWMRSGAARGWQVFAEAHASRTGTARHDDVLSEDRYLVTRAFLESQLLRAGVDAARLRIYGEGVGFRHSPMPGEDPRARSVYVVVQPDPPPSPPTAWPPPVLPVQWLPKTEPVSPPKTVHVTPIIQKIIIAQGIEIRDVDGPLLLKFLNNNCDAKKGDVWTWTFPKGAGVKATHEVHVVYDLISFAKALDTADAFVVYDGHSRYGQGPAFGDAGMSKVPDVKKFPVNPWGVHFRMGYDATDTECMADLVHHSVTPVEYDLIASDPKAFLPSALIKAAKNAQAQHKAIKAKKIKDKAICSTAGAWRLFDTCDAKLAATRTARGDTPLKGRHFYAQLLRKSENEFTTAVQVGSVDLDKSSLRCKLLFMASCSSHVHFFAALNRRRKAVKSPCKFLMTAMVCSATHSTNFLEQILIKGLDPMTERGLKAVVKALNGFSDAGIVGDY
jgi:outer membrane protein OmpA-like peptidoglycan-associated protein